MMTLGEFIQSEIKRTNLSMREFSQKVGVSHMTISKYSLYGLGNTYAGRTIGEPPLSFLAKLAKATSVDLCTIVALIYPESTMADPVAGILSSRIRRLSPEQRQLMDTFLRGLAFDNLQGGEDDGIEIVERPD